MHFFLITPDKVQVGSDIISPSSKSWPRAGIVSVFTSLQPHLHILTIEPSNSWVAWTILLISL